MYRDGIGGPTFAEKSYELEGPGGPLGDEIKSFAPGYDPKMLYVFVNRKVSTRFFEKANGDVVNPGPGTVVDKAIVESDGNALFDFYMIANKNTVATALPVHYKVVINTTNLTKAEIEELTYHQCYGYYGFGGPVKIPCSVMYASKIAEYVADNGFSDNGVNAVPSDRLSCHLHFL